jgi:hypothetical protein
MAVTHMGEKDKRRSNPGFAGRVLELFQNMDEFYVDSDRATAILAAARVDVQLERTLGVLLQPPRKRSADFLDQNRALNSLAAKAQLLERLGVIDKGMGKAIEALRNIRNDAAHHHLAFDLEVDPQAPKVDQLAEWAAAENAESEGWYANLFPQFEGRRQQFRQCVMLLVSRLEAQFQVLVNQQRTLADDFFDQRGDDIFGGRR